MSSIEIDGMMIEDLPLKDAVDMTRNLLERPGLDLVICTTEASFFRTDISEEKKNWLESASLNVFDVITGKKFNGSLCSYRHKYRRIHDLAIDIEFT